MAIAISAKKQREKYQKNQKNQMKRLAQKAPWQAARGSNFGNNAQYPQYNNQQRFYNNEEYYGDYTD